MRRDKAIRTIDWKDGAVVMIDQRALPLVERYVACTDYRQVISAIKDLTVRGAPAIGVAASMGIALGVRGIDVDTPDAFRRAFEEICGQFAASRPTARNLFWAIERMKRRFEQGLPVAAGMPGEILIGDGPARSSEGGARGRGHEGTWPSTGAAGDGPPSPDGFSMNGPNPCPDAAPRRDAPQGHAPEKVGQDDRSDDPWRALRDALAAEAIAIAEEDIAVNLRLGANGRDLIPDGARVLTHCNAGALATAGFGTALGVIRAARQQGKRVHVYVDETRPVLQGSRLTAWELMREQIPCTLITDGMAGFLMQRGAIDLVIVGADRIAANGDTANKIGTYALAVLARAHGIPLYVAAPRSTIDPSLTHGGSIVIEERNPEEVTGFGGVRTAPEGVAVWNPAFDMTPHALVAAIITETGVLRPPYGETIAQIFVSARD
ncbi:MAG: S-methyl-5-thioribose-1-phosphate isomerase [Thermodesulfobacteriota bacterium]